MERKFNTVSPLRKARIEQGKTLEEVARKARPCDAGGLSKIERGEQNASPELAARLADALGHAITELEILYPHRYMTPAKKGRA